MYGKEVMEQMEEHTVEDAFHFPFEPIYEEDPVVATNIVRLRKRSAEGMQKYGTTMMRDDLTEEDWIEHAIEEALDFANYLEALKRKIKRSRMGGSD